MNWAAVFQFLLALLTIASGVYATRAAVRGARAEAKQRAVEAKKSAEGEGRKQNFEEMKASLQAARDDNAYLKKEASDARAEKGRVEVESREREARLKQDWREQLDQERAGCKEAVETFSRRLAIQLDPILPPKRIREGVERVPHDSEDLFHTDIGKGLDEQFGDGE